MTTGPVARWGLVLAYMAGLFVLSSIHDLPVPAAEGSDKVGHAILYAGLAAVSLRALAGGRWAGVTLGCALQAMLIAVAYGGFDEFHQSFVSGRSSELADVAANATGAVTAAVAARAWVILTRH